MRKVIALLALFLACGAKPSQGGFISDYGTVVKTDGLPISAHEFNVMQQDYELYGLEISGCTSAEALHAAWSHITVTWVKASKEGLFTDPWDRQVYGYEQHKGPNHDSVVFVGKTDHVWHSALAHEFTHALKMVCTWDDDYNHVDWKNKVEPVLFEIDVRTATDCSDGH